MSVIWLLYNWIFLSGLILGLPFFILRVATGRRFRTGLRERLTCYGILKNKLASGKSIWIQAASVGEVSASLPLIKMLRSEFAGTKIILTCQTAAGRGVARSKLPEGVIPILCPLDLGILVRRLVRLVSPRILILVETELWPGLITTAWKRKIPVIMVSGRISASAYRGYSQVKPLLRPLLEKIAIFNMRSEEDAARVRAMGAPCDRVHVTGNIKFDSFPAGDIDPGIKKQLSIRLGLLPGDLLIVGGSTYKGEEALLLEAMGELSLHFPRLRLVLAPRHLERVGEIEEVLRSRKQPYSRFTSLVEGKTGEAAKVIILDQMGVLFNLYSLATAVFVGRSLRSQGGQNPIEPASLGKAVLFGPHMENFRDIAEDLVRAGGAVQLGSDAALAPALNEILSDEDRRRRLGERARRVVEKRRGASQKNLETIRRLIA